MYISDEIADRDKERRNLSLLKFFLGDMEPAPELFALRQWGCAHHKFLHLCIAITEFLVY